VISNLDLLPSGFLNPEQKLMNLAYRSVLPPLSLTTMHTAPADHAHGAGTNSPFDRVRLEPRAPLDGIESADNSEARKKDREERNRHGRPGALAWRHYDRCGVCNVVR
jgi:hypothetical protein